MKSIQTSPDAIIIFSGGIVPIENGPGERQWRSTTYDESDAFGTLGGRDRVEAGALLARKYPKSYLVTTSHRLGRVVPSLAQVYADELRDLGVSGTRIIEEERSSTTQTAVIVALRLAEKKRWTRLLFLSSGFHLQRIETFYKLSKSAITVECVSSESILIEADSAFEARFAAVQKTLVYQLRLESEQRGLVALKNGLYKSAPAKDKQER